MRTAFQQALDELETRLQEEGNLVLRSLRGALQALERQDVGLADEVIAFDDDVDARYRGIEKGVELVLARHTPVASDLRLVLAILHGNMHLERIADQCVTIAKLTKLTHALAQEQRMLEGFEEMGARAEEMIRIALESFAARNLELARSLAGLDELLDTANRHVVEQVMALPKEAALQEWGMRMIVVSRCLERIGDNAVDIGEQTEYLVTGEFREYTDASHPEGRAL